MTLSQNCANCLHWDGQGWCALTREAKAIGGHIISPLLVVCAKHEPAELDIEGAAARVRAIARCQHCRDSFIPTRTSAVYCRKCGGQKIRWRLAQRARRARFKKEGLTARGTRPRGRHE